MRHQTGQCPCCGRYCHLTRHHLIPKKLHRRVRFRKRYTRAELASDVYICRLCHDGIHNLYDEMTLAKEYASLSALLEDENLQRHYDWVARQKGGLAPQDAEDKGTTLSARVRTTNSLINSAKRSG